MAYSKKTWNNDEVITQEAMNNIESGVAANDLKNTQQDGKISALEAKVVNAVAGTKDGLMSKEDKAKLDGVAAQANKYVLPAANKSTPGGVKQATLVAEASGENVTKAEFKALLDALKAAGIMANS